MEIAFSYGPKNCVVFEVRASVVSQISREEIKLQFWEKISSVLEPVRLLIERFQQQKKLGDLKWNFRHHQLFVDVLVERWSKGVRIFLQTVKGWASSNSATRSLIRICVSCSRENFCNAVDGAFVLGMINSPGGWIFISKS